MSKIDDLTAAQVASNAATDALIVSHQTLIQSVKDLTAQLAAANTGSDPAIQAVIDGLNTETAKAQAETAATPA